MKLIKIYPYTVGLVYKGDAFQKVITEGRYFVKPFENVIIYDMTKEFRPSTDLEILLKDEELAEMLDVIEISDNEIGIYYEGKNYKNILTPGKYACWKNAKDYSVEITDTNDMKVDINLNKTILFHLNTKQYIQTCNVEKYQKGLLFVDGELVETLGAGVYYFWKNLRTINVKIIDTRALQMEFSGQEILTKDKANIRLNFIGRFKIVDELKAVLENNDYERQLYVIMQLALREYIGTKTLDAILENKLSIEKEILEALKSKASELGIDILSCGIKDIILPGDVKEIMNKVLIAEKKAQANLIKRREETASTRNLLNTAKLMGDNKMLFKLKQMEYIETIAEKVGKISLGTDVQFTTQMNKLFEPEA
ncbi:slipin family protein [Candidatus Kapabacteria bacterium]|nr:slipin family protein [Candidatus Kapabacteria bacterium]